jgi:hypothetical protein
VGKIVNALYIIKLSIIFIHIYVFKFVKNVDVCIVVVLEIPKWFNIFYPKININMVETLSHQWECYIQGVVSQTMIPAIK